MLSEKDVDNANNDPGLVEVSEVLNYPSEKLYEGFEPEEDPWDKRLLYEVTGMRLDDTDYRGDDTSSDEDTSLLIKDKVSRVSRMKQSRKSIDMQKFDSLMEKLADGGEESEDNDDPQRIN